MAFDAQLSAAIQALMNQPGLTDQQKIQKAYDVAQKRGISPEQIAANSPFTVDQINRAFSKLAPAGSPMPAGQEFIPGSTTNPAVPPTGLIGSEQALQGGYANALQGIQMGTNDALATLGRTGDAGLDAINSSLNPYAGGGTEAFNLQAALTGARGKAAQQQAFDDFLASPGQEFLRSQGERSLINQAAALGGLGGGNVRKDLIRFGQGVAAQDFQSAFDRLSSLSGMGLNAAGQKAALGGNLIQSLGLTGAGFQNQAGRDVANISQRTGEVVGAGRTRAGELQAQAISDTVSALSGLQERGGTGLRDIIDAAGGNLASLLRGAGLQEGQSIEQLATILANLRTGQGSQLASLPSLGSTQQTQGILGGIGQAASGIGTMMAASDARLKENLVLVGQHPAGMNLYTWEWNEAGREIAGDQDPFGVLAQEVMETHPEAVTVGIDGFLRVDYTKVN